MLALVASKNKSADPLVTSDPQTPDPGRTWAQRRSGWQSLVPTWAKYSNARSERFLLHAQIPPPPWVRRWYSELFFLFQNPFPFGEIDHGAADGARWVPSGLK